MFRQPVTPVTVSLIPANSGHPGNLLSCPVAAEVTRLNVASAADNTDDNYIGGSMRPLLLAAVALLAVGIANIDIEPTKTVTKTVMVKAPAKRITRVKRVEVPRRLDGYISRKQCVQLADGTKFRDIINRFGWPAGDDSTDSYSDSYMNIPLREDHSSFCSIDLYEDEITAVQVL